MIDGGPPVQLAPQVSRIRQVQHQLAERYALVVSQPGPGAAPPSGDLARRSRLISCPARSSLWRASKVLGSRRLPSVLSWRCRRAGQRAVLTREPGGTAIGEQIRVVLLGQASSSMLPTTEMLLFAAARAQHVGEVIAPALAGMA